MERGPISVCAHSRTLSRPCSGSPRHCSSLSVRRCRRMLRRPLRRRSGSGSLATEDRRAGDRALAAGPAGWRYRAATAGLAQPVRRPTPAARSVGYGRWTYVPFARRHPEAFTRWGEPAPGALASSSQSIRQMHCAPIRNRLAGCHKAFPKACRCTRCSPRHRRRTSTHRLAPSGERPVRLLPSLSSTANICTGKLPPVRHTRGSASTIPGAAMVRTTGPRGSREPGPMGVLGSPRAS